ncbi:hypothetical protein HAX39_23475 [Citrobacter freundii]|nr:hypothetical protein [Citrobacter freundii]
MQKEYDSDLHFADPHTEARNKIRNLQMKSSSIGDLLKRLEKRIEKDTQKQLARQTENVTLSLRMKKHIATLLDVPKEDCYCMSTAMLIENLRKEKNESSSTASKILEEITKVTENLLQLSAKK